MKVLGLTLLLATFVTVNANAQKQASCDKVEKKLRRQADRCLKRRNFSKRKQCFDRIGKKTESKRLAHCEAGFERMAMDYSAKEKSMFPKDPGSIQNDGPRDQYAGAAPGAMNKGHMNDMEFKGKNHEDHMMPPQQDKRMCDKVARMIKKRGAKCLRLKSKNRRQMCFQKLGEAKHRRVQDGCKEQLDPIAGKLMEKEKAKYKTTTLDSGPDSQGHNVKAPKIADSKGHSVNMCNKIAKKAHKKGHRCLRLKNNKRRRKCFDAAGKYIDRRVGEGCRAQLDPVARELEGKEMQMYKMSSFKGGEHNHDGMHHKKEGDNQGHSQRMCKKIAKKAKKRASRCLKKKNETARKACLDKVGEGIHRRVGEGCRKEVNPVRDWVIAQEQSRYKTNSVKGDENDSHHHDGLAPTSAEVDPATCRRVASFAKSMGKSCLHKYKDQSKRKRCTDLLKNNVDKQLGGKDGCHQEKDSFMAWYLGQESQKYPGQEASFMR